MMAKNIGAVEKWVRLIVGGILILLGLNLSGWMRWVSGLVGLAFVLTSAFGY